MFAQSAFVPQLVSDMEIRKEVFVSSAGRRSRVRRRKKRKAKCQRLAM